MSHPARARGSCPPPDSDDLGSVLDVEGVPQGAVQLGTLSDPQITDGPRFQFPLGDRYEIVAVDDARLRQSLLGPDLDLRTDMPNRSSDRCTRDCGQDLDSGVSCKDADGSPSCRRAKVGPDQVAAGYHSGTVLEARRLALMTTSGSCGTRR